MLGYVLVLLASVFFCIQNVVVRILFADQVLLGLGETGGFLEPTLQNSFLLMLLRMLLAVPLSALVAQRFHRQTWKDLFHLFDPANRKAFFHALAGGGLMFAYLALLYLAIGLIATGIALTLFFTSPVFTALFSWRFFGIRPSAAHWTIMAIVLAGSTLTIPPAQWSGGGSALGVILAIAAGATYALYTVNTQKSFDYLHPVPYTWINFLVALLLSALCLLVWPRTGSSDLAWGSIWIGSLVSGIVTFIGHGFYNAGIRQIGATSTAMIGAANPAFTVVLAWFVIQETLTPIQVLGVAIVTLSVVSLSRFSQSRVS